MAWRSNRPFIDCWVLVLVKHCYCSQLEWPARKVSHNWWLKLPLHPTALRCQGRWHLLHGICFFSVTQRQRQPWFTVTSLQWCMVGRAGLTLPPLLPKAANHWQRVFFWTNKTSTAHICVTLYPWHMAVHRGTATKEQGSHSVSVDFLWVPNMWWKPNPRARLCRMFNSHLS